MPEARDAGGPISEPDTAPGSTVQIIPVPGLPEVHAGADLAGLVVEALRAASLTLRTGDILVVAQKIVSKSEGLRVRIADVTPSEEARALASRLGKDPRKVAVILGESRRVVKAEWPEGKPEGVLVCEHRSGCVSANAGVDESNTGEPGTVLLLPRDPDASATRLADGVARLAGTRPAVVITDSFGRPWRLGIVNVAIGIDGIPAMLDVRGRFDREGRVLTASVLAVADEVAAAAGLVMGKTAGVPVVLVRGLRFEAPAGRASDLARSAKEDLFR